MAKATEKTDPIKAQIDMFLPIQDAKLEDFKVGDIVRDRHSLFIGVIAVDIRWLNGTRRFQLSGVNQNGDPASRVLDDVAVSMLKPAEVDRTPVPSGEFWLGDKVKHAFIKDGGKGIITAVFLNENGCVQYEVVVPYKASHAYLILHEHELKMIEQAVVAAPIVERTGAASDNSVTLGRGHMR